MKLPKQKLDALRKRVGLLRGFRDDHINAVLEYARRRDLRDGELIISEGTLSTKVFIIIAGAAIVSRRVDAAEEQIATLSVGATVGEMGIIDSSPRSARVVAKGNSTILEIEMEGFHQLSAEAKSILYRNLCRVLVQRIRGANTRIKDLAEALPEHIDVESLVLENGLVGAELDGLKASGVAAANAQFRAAIFSESEFAGADFTSANFAGADFERATFLGASMEGATFKHALFAGADFEGADFRGADLSKAVFDEPGNDTAEHALIGAIGGDEEHSIDESTTSLMRSTLPPTDTDDDE